MTLQTARRIGSQTPRIACTPLFVTSAGDDAVEIAKLANLVLDPWQEHVLRASLGETANGRWASFRVGLVVPRQNGKNVIIEARELAGALLFGEKTILHTAHQLGTSQAAQRKLMERIFDSPLVEHIKGYEPGLELEQIRGFRRGNNSPAIFWNNGAAIEYKSRGRGARGLSGDLIILDEALFLEQKSMEATVPVLASKSMEGNTQIWFTSSAGLAHSDALANLRQLGMDGAERVTYLEWSSSDDRDPLDKDGWYEANPSLGIRISEQYVQDEYDTLTMSGGVIGFQRERLGIWEKLGGDPEINPKKWAACSTTAMAPRTPLCFSIDVPPERSKATIGMASIDAAGLVHVQVIDERDGLDWVPGRVKDLQDAWAPLTTVVDARGAASTLIPLLREKRVRILHFDALDYARGCGEIYDLIEAGTLRHRNQESLNLAVENAKKKIIGQSTSWIWNRRNVTVNLSPLVAVTYALVGLRKRNAARIAGDATKPKVRIIN